MSDFGRLNSVLRRGGAVPIDNERAFRESILEGSTVRQVAERHGVAPSQAHGAIKAGAEEFVRQVHLDLLASHGSGELPAVLVPTQVGPTLDRSLDFCRWLTNELEDRGIHVRLHYRQAVDGGLIIAFSDRDAPPNSKANVEALDEKEQP
jgi:hypothetical protein